jgi:hypothetical protein
MQTIYDSRRFVKSAHPFGRGISPRPVTSFEPSPEDRAEAAAMFDALEQVRYLDELESQAQQAAWDAQFRLPAGLCELCGEPSDGLDPIHKLCPDCLAAAENATIAGQNGRAGLGYRVF